MRSILGSIQILILINFKMMPLRSNRVSITNNQSKLKRAIPEPVPTRPEALEVASLRSLTLFAHHFINSWKNISCPLIIGGGSLNGTKVHIIENLDTLCKISYEYLMKDILLSTSFQKRVGEHSSLSTSSKNRKRLEL